MARVVTISSQDTCPGWSVQGCLSSRYYTCITCRVPAPAVAICIGFTCLTMLVPRVWIWVAPVPALLITETQSIIDCQQYLFLISEFSAWLWLTHQEGLYGEAFCLQVTVPNILMMGLCPSIAMRRQSSTFWAASCEFLIQVQMWSSFYTQI